MINTIFPNISLWIGAGFIRNHIWDQLSDFKGPPLKSDIDVIYYDKTAPDTVKNRQIEEGLKKQASQYEAYFGKWSVTNQYAMAQKNGDAEYMDLKEALSKWPETATAIAAQLTVNDDIKLLCPFGVNDLKHFIIRPTPLFSCKKKHIFQKRLDNKQWQKRWPRLKIEA